jgi:type IX secretion system PorP/SprF family membrane protein
MGKKFIIRCLALVVIMSGYHRGFAQDAEFTQFYANPIYLNPAFAGTFRCPRVSLNYRNQWPSLRDAFVTYSATYDQHVEALSGGVGVMITSDRAGTGALTTNSAALVYSYQLPITRKFSIQAGAQVNYTEKSVDWDQLTFGDQIDPRRGFVYTSQEQQTSEPNRFPDFSVGALGFSERFFGGFAVHHLTEPNETVVEDGDSPLPRKYTVHGGAVIPVRVAGVEKGVISPNLMYRSQGGSNQLNFGLYGTRGPIVGGLWFRQNFNNSDAFIALIGFYMDSFKVGYSYDITVSELSNQSGGAHELSFTLQFGCRKKRVKWRTARCPTF